MPNQNDSTQNPGNTPVVPPAGTTPPPVISPQSDLPPLPPAFQNLGSEETPAPTEAIPPPSDTGSAAPPDISSVISKPKKKFGGGKIIATILGLFLLVGGVGAGIILTQQPQLLQQKAATITTLYCSKFNNDDCIYGCKPDENGGTCNPAPTPEPGPGCSNDLCDTQSCCSSYTCTSAPDGHKHCIGSGSTCSNGVSCSNPSDCHCQGGDVCTGIVCDPTIHQQCLSQGRAWCTNMTGRGMTCCAVGYVCAKGVNGCVPGTTTPTPTPPVNPPAPYCSAVTAWKSDYSKQLSSADLSALTSGTVVNFCVSGGGPSGTTFDQAKFTINGTILSPTTTHRTGSSDFCQSYTILPTDTTVNVSAQIHSGSNWY